MFPEKVMRNYFYRKEFELFFCILIIAVLAVLQIKAYMPARIAAKTAHSLGASFHYARIDDVQIPRHLPVYCRY